FDGAARPYVLLDMHSLAARCSLNAGKFDEAREHHDKARELRGRRHEAPEPRYPEPELHWVAWAAPLVSLHAEGPGVALREGLGQYRNYESRDLLAHLMLASGDRAGVKVEEERWRDWAEARLVARERIFARAV